MRKIIALLLSVFLVLSFSACSDKDKEWFELKDAEGTWEKRTLESGEEYLYDNETKTMILKAYRYAGTGYGGSDRYEEIPLDDYLINKNTWQTITGEQELLDEYDLCSEENEKFTRESWITVFGESEITDGYFKNEHGGLTVHAPDGGELVIPEAYTFYERFTPVISLKWGTIRDEKVYECVSRNHDNGKRDGIIEFCVQK